MTEATPRPIDTVIEIESARIELGIKKKDLCKIARIKPEMFSYVLRRGREGKELPEACLAKIRKALNHIKEKKTA